MAVLTPPCFSAEIRPNKIFSSNLVWFGIVGGGKSEVSAFLVQASLSVEIHMIQLFEVFVFINATR